MAFRLGGSGGGCVGVVVVVLVAVGVVVGAAVAVACGWGGGRARVAECSDAGAQGEAFEHLMEHDDCEEGQEEGVAGDDEGEADD
jgi:uncharacterized membrane protein